MRYKTLWSIQQAEQPGCDMYNKAGIQSTVLQAVGHIQLQLVIRHACAIYDVITSLMMSRRKFPLYVSQDSNPLDSEVTSVIKSFINKGVRHMMHTPVPVANASTSAYSHPYVRIASHYKHVLQTFFDCFHYPRLLMLEVGMHCKEAMRTYASPILHNFSHVHGSDSAVN